MIFYRGALAGLVILASAVSGCEGTARAGSVTTGEQDRGAIDKTRNEYMAAWKKGSADRVAALYADDAIVLYPNQPAVVGGAAIQAYFRSFYDQYAQDDFALTSDEVRIAGSWAFDRGSYRLAMAPRGGGPRIEDHGKYLVILARQADGSWKIARDMDNSDRPLPMR
jgi:uncharacterized protein (TIGR02246 family)